MRAAHALRRRSRSAKDFGIIGQASWLSSVINLVNTIIGAGVLAMPSVLSHMGIVPGTLVIIWAGLTSGFGLYLQTRCARYLDRGSASFFALSQITYPNAAVIFDTAIAIKCFGVGVSYLIIIGDLMPGVVKGIYENAGQLEFLVDRHFWVTAFMLVVIPLSFLRRLDSLKYTSVVALTSIGYLVILVVAHFFKGDTMANRGDIRVVRWGGAIPALSSLPVVVFAYTCHQNMFSVLNEINNNSHYRTTTVIFTSIGSAGMVYILVGITGYLSFGNSVSGNIIGMYIPSIVSTIGKAAIVVLVMFSYPLQIHPCRASVDAVLKWRPLKRSSSTRSPNRSPSRTMPLLNSGKSIGNGRDDSMGETRFAAITTIIIVSSYLVAMSVTSLERSLAYVGSTGSTSISFILPGLFYYKISAPDSPLHQSIKDDDDETGDSESGYDEGLLGGGGTRTSRLKKDLIRTLSLALAIYGLIVMVVCFITNTFFIVAH
ncbi:hypothetical protein FGG08_001277 [Glutinoglossum americanum]|uniref:Amino acid transporter transmembrane domain-containing protein n=1 Tax=Glutinoglossum americanum TaxID=1670608 RepID=A0A9P8IF49_9PEZI|nr:hypothetical protein FGG08_001277 [Glutinoglossum americanum]